MKASPHFTISFYILKVWILIYIARYLCCVGDVLDCFEKINLNSKCCRPVPGCAVLPSHLIFLFTKDYYITQCISAICQGDNVVDINI